MSARIEIKPGHTYRTIAGCLVRVVYVEGWRVTYRPEFGVGLGYRKTTSVVDFSKAIAEDVTP